MKIYISADIEGCAGVTNWEETRYGGQGYEQACRQMTRETAAACKAALEAGCEVVIKDGHEDAVNIDPEGLPKGVQIIRGWRTSPAGMMGGINESFDGAVYIGYHSPEGKTTSPLAHTVEHDWFSWVKLNGQIASEFTFNALLASDYGVPSVFLSGDKGMCDLAETEYPGILTFATKEGTGNSTWNLHPDDAVSGIYSGMKEALSGDFSLKKPEREYTVEFWFKDAARVRAASWYPGAERTGEMTVAFTAESVRDLLIAKMYMTEI